MPRLIGMMTVAFMMVFAFNLNTAEAQVAAGASSGGFGAAFGYAANIGGVTFTAAGTIGNGTGFGIANAAGNIGCGHNCHQPTCTHDCYRTQPCHNCHPPQCHNCYHPQPPCHGCGGGGSTAFAFASSHGNASAFASAVGSPFGSTVNTQAIAFGGAAQAFGFAGP